MSNGLLTGVLFLVALVALPSSSNAVSSVNPFSGAKLFVDPDSSAAQQIRAWGKTKPAYVVLLRKIASGSTANWFGDWNVNLASDVNDRIVQIAKAHALPVFVIYNIPRRDCGGYSAGGAKSSTAYRKWIDMFSSAVAKRKIALILEPDALSGLDCLSSSERATRLALIRYAVTRFTKYNRAATVYVDAGHSAWQPADEMARRLMLAGIANARGFSLNVSNTQTSADSLNYGSMVSDLIGGKHFVVDTSRNGLGPLPESQWKKPEDAWCNSPGRALGARPTNNTGRPLADAFLWVKPPGDSDGSCNGGPPAGDWWLTYALGLARRAPW